MSRKLFYALVRALGVDECPVYKVHHFVGDNSTDKERLGQYLSNVLEELFPDPQPRVETEYYIDGFLAGAEYFSGKEVVEVGEVPYWVKDAYDADYSVSTYNQYSDNDE